MLKALKKINCTFSVVSFGGISKSDMALIHCCRACLTRDTRWEYTGNVYFCWPGEVARCYKLPRFILRRAVQIRAPSFSAIFAREQHFTRAFCRIRFTGEATSIKHKKERPKSLMHWYHGCRNNLSSDLSPVSCGRGDIRDDFSCLQQNMSTYVSCLSLWVISNHPVGQVLDATYTKHVETWRLFPLLHVYSLKHTFFKE